VSALKDPALHWMQLDADDWLIVPAAQFVHPDAPLDAEIVPAAQLVQPAEPSNEYVPALQMSTHEAESAAEYLPPAQLLQASNDCAPVSGM